MDGFEIKDNFFTKVHKHSDMLTVIVQGNQRVGHTGLRPALIRIPNLRKRETMKLIKVE